MEIFNNTYPWYIEVFSFLGILFIFGLILCLLIWLYVSISFKNDEAKKRIALLYTLERDLEVNTKRIKEHDDLLCQILMGEKNVTKS